MYRDLFSIHATLLAQSDNVLFWQSRNVRFCPRIIARLAINLEGGQLWETLL
jgi:hypothetical protein